MSARDYFEAILADVGRVALLEREVESARVAAGPHGLGQGAGSGGPHDAMAAIDRLIDSDVEAELGRLAASVRARVGQALAVLYGADGRGGLARSRGSTDADILCCRYLQGYTWREIAAMMEAGSGDWCRMRANRALAWLDRQDADAASGA